MPVVSPKFILKSTVSEAVEGCMPSVTFGFGCYDPHVHCFTTSHVQRRNNARQQDDNLILAARDLRLEKEGREAKIIV